MSRALPWCSKPSNLIQQMIPVANEYRLYLVNEIGPTSFLFKDDSDNKFKVVIGNIVSCSCGVVTNHHCIHTLYVMLKKFKVPETNPILWQAAYLDSELQALINHRYQAKQPKAKKKYLPKKKTFSQKDLQFPALGQDQMCPICYEGMVSSCYSTCRTCSKNYHTKCFRVWTRHKEENGVPVTCPMCRSIFPNPMHVIFQDLERWKTRFSLHKGTLCQGCNQKNIKGKIYRCLICQNIVLCRLCFQSYQHNEHRHYCSKEMATDKWRIVTQRVKGAVRPAQQQQEEEQKDIKWIINIFPTLKQHEETKIDHLGIIGNYIRVQKCHKCKETGDNTMRRLYCGHSYHEQCLNAMINQEEFTCVVDEQPICAGYFRAFGIQVKKNNHKNSNVAFINDNEELDVLRNKTGFSAKLKTGKKGSSIGQHRKEMKRQGKSKQKNFRIVKKNYEKKIQNSNEGWEINSGMVVFGLGQQIKYQHPKILLKTRKPQRL